MNLKDLKKPFKEEDIEWRIQQAGIKDGKPWGMCLAYVTNRAIMERLDDVCGAENWKNEFGKAPEGGILCGISIKTDGEWVTKFDGAENTDIESVKGGLSSSMKRAAVQWGIGRYLYRLDTYWAKFTDKGEFKAKIKDKKTGQEGWYNWDAPKLPRWALPSTNQSEKIPEGNKGLQGQIQAVNIMFDKIASDTPLEKSNYRICRLQMFAKIIGKKGLISSGMLDEAQIQTIADALTDHKRVQAYISKWMDENSEGVK